MSNFEKGQTQVVIVSGARTPFGKFGGAFVGTSATELGMKASKAAIERSGLAPQDIDQVIFGNVIQSSPDAAYLARHIGLACAIGVEKPALTLNRLCGSGLQAILSGAEQIQLGKAKAVLVGGTENMSQAPFQMWGARFGISLGGQKMGDALWDALTDSYAGVSMGLTAEKLAKKFEISREESDQFSFDSQQKTKRAQEAQTFLDEIVPVEMKAKGKMIWVTSDEHPRPQTTMEALQKLPPVFSGVVTAGSSSGICDGAAALVLTSKAYAQKKGLNILAHIAGEGVVGCEPTEMGLGPVPAIGQTLSSMNKKLEDVDLFEINEAFAPQVLACQKSLGIPTAKLNVNGGAIALGHPLAASGARLALSLVFELKRRQKKLGVVSACIGGGQGIALGLSV